MWLDAYLEKPEKSKEDVEGELWMVHSGGFYEVERKKIGPGRMPKTLHWFKYEALFTWVSGVFLLGVVYYLNASAYLLDPLKSSLSPAQGVSLAVGTIALSWFVYDSIWQTLGLKNQTFATAVSVLLAAGIGYGFCRVFSGRAAFIHMGAMFGTWMVANVWVRILPAQQKMIDATKEGRAPDLTHSAHAKRRSVHNTYLTYPVLFMMLSNHYAMAYGEQNNSIVLLCLVILGAAIRHVMVAPKANEKAGRPGRGLWALIPATLALAGLFALTGNFHSQSSAQVVTSGEHVSFKQVQAVIQQRCVVCHSAHPTITHFGPTPGGVSFEIAENIQHLSERIKVRAVVTKTMPLANLSHITDDERELLGRWVAQGAHLE